MYNLTPSAVLKLVLACGVVLLGSISIFPGAGTAHAQGLCPGTDYQFFEEDGLVVIEAESQPPAGDWESRTAISGFTGTSYYKWEGPNLGGNPGSGVITYRIRINNPGTYRFTMRSRIAEGNSNTDSNDLWLRFDDAEGFFGFRASDNSFVYPVGNGRGPGGTDQTPDPEGTTRDGWLKAYMNTLNQWRWDARTSDNDAHNIFVTFNQSRTYTMEISGRSRGFAVDRFVLFDESVYTEDAIEVSNRPETGCDGNSLFSVLETTPDDNEDDVSPGRNIEVVFSKPATVSGRWFRILCPPTNTVVNVDNATVTPDRTAFTINPNSNFPNGYTCTMTIISSLVRDSDNNPLPGGNYTFSFTVRGNARPVIIGTTPEDNASLVDLNTNIRIDFSENVTVDGTWFVIECEPGVTTIRPDDVVVTGSGATRTINPNAPLPLGDTCTVEVRANRIDDSNGDGLLGGNYEFSFTVGSLEALDVNNDDLITPADVVFIVNRVGENVNAGNNAADVNEDNVINTADADLVASAIGESVP
ncbi:MAG: Ig-like domain-containing protein [Chloroflexota bacterium]